MRETKLSFRERKARALREKTEFGRASAYTNTNKLAKLS